MGSTGEERLVRIETGSVLLEGNLSLPEGACELGRCKQRVCGTATLLEQARPR
jgi:hypothetical protein